MSHSRRQLPPVDLNKRRERDEIFEFLRPSTARKQPMSSPKLLKPKPLYPKDMARMKPSIDTCPPPLPASPRAVTLASQSRAFVSPSRGNYSRATAPIKPTPMYPRLVGQMKSSMTDASASEPLSPRAMATQDMARSHPSRFAPYHPMAKSPRGAATPPRLMYVNSREMAPNKSFRPAHPPPMRGSFHGTTPAKSSKADLPLKHAYPRDMAPTNKHSKGATSLLMHDCYRRTDPTTKSSMHSSSRGMARTKSSKDDAHPLRMHASSREMARTKSSKGTSDPPTPPPNMNMALAGYFAHEYLTKGTLFGKPYAGPTEAMAPSPVSWSSSSSVNVGTTKHSGHSYVDKGKGIAVESEPELDASQGYVHKGKGIAIESEPELDASQGYVQNGKGKQIAVESGFKPEPHASHDYVDKLKPESNRRSDKDLAYTIVSMMLKEGAHLKGIVNPSQLASLLNASLPEKK